MHRALIAGSLVLFSCAPIVISDRVEEQTISERKERVARPGSARITAEAILLTDQPGFLLSAQRSEQCEETLVAEVRGTRRIRRAPDWSSGLLWTGVGAVGVGIGSWVLADASNVPTSSDPYTRNPISRSGAYTSGVVLTAAGGAAVIAGVVTMLRGLDTSEDLGARQVRRQVDVACKVTPASNIKVELIPVAHGLEGTSIPLGSTSPNGKLRISKSQLRALFETTPGADKAHLRVGPSQGDIDLRGPRAAMARAASEAALTLAKADRVDEAEAELNFATKLGAETASARVALADAPTTKRRLAEAQEAHERKWGRDIKEWGTREENQHVYRLLRSLLINVNKLKGLKAEWDAEKQKNDESETEDEVTVKTLYREISGTFAFRKILDRRAREALFEAEDEYFVLRLGAGQSFHQYDGEPTTLHTRGATILMSDGDRLPVFIPGPSPVEKKRKKGHHPNRGRENALKKESDSLEPALEARFTELTRAGSRPGERKLTDEPDGVRVRLFGSTAQTIERITIGSEKAVYCIDVGGEACARDGETITLAEFCAK